MSDTISRQAAIDAINQICPIDTEYDCTLLDRVDVRCVLTDLPSAQPERKKGRWIDMDDHVMCGCCGATHYGSDKNFCPSCGAKMGEEGKDD